MRASGQSGNRSSDGPGHGHRLIQDIWRAQQRGRSNLAGLAGNAGPHRGGGSGWPPATDRAYAGASKAAALLRLCREYGVGLLTGAPDWRAARATLPHLRTDGSSVTVTHQTFQIVFTLTDSGERVEHFACDMHGGLLGGIGASAYAEFCPPPSAGD